MPENEEKAIQITIEDDDELTSGNEEAAIARLEPVQLQRTVENAIVSHTTTYGTAQISKEESEALNAPIDPQVVEIRPDGLLYLPGNEYRSRLNSILGAGQWALRHIADGRISRQNDDVFWYRGELWIRGEFIAEAIGEQPYKSQNANSSWVTAREGAKTDCLVRCCKDLGIANELWNPQYTAEWKKNHARPVKMVPLNGGKEKWFWFRNGARVFYSGYKEVKNA